MGNCDSKICGSSELQVTANPDVAGIGVLVAFATSAVLSLCAIIYGYFTDSFPENTLTQCDRYLILAPIRARFASYKDFLCQAFHIKDRGAKGNVGVEHVAARTKRGRAMERFILTLSDQQLITGFAVLTAGYSKICSMSIYHFNIVASLAWFSSATHLATLSVLRPYLVAHPAVRNWRVVAMILLLLMLLVAQLPAWSDGDNSRPVCCFFRDMDIEINFPNFVTLITTLGFLIIIYTERIARLYSLDVDWNISDSYVELFVRLLLRKQYRKPSRKEVAEQSIRAGKLRSSINALIRQERERVRYGRFRSIAQEKNSYVKSTHFIAQEMSYTFVNQANILIFDLTYGFAYTIICRMDEPIGGIEGNQNEMGFGQLVPLLLLLLPALAVGEIYFESRGEIRAAPNNPSFRSCRDTSATTNKTSSPPSSNTDISLGTFPVPFSSQQSQSEKTDSASPCSVSEKVVIKQFSAQDEPILEELLRSLNPAISPESDTNKAVGDATEPGHTNRGVRKWNTGLALQEVHKYNSEQAAIPANKGENIQGQASSPSQGNQEPKINAASSPSSHASPSEALQQSQSSREASTGIEGASPTSRRSSHIHYRRILLGVFIFQLTFQILFALALAGVFGEEGYLLASSFLVLLLVVVFVGINDGVWQRIKEVKGEPAQIS